MSHSLKEDRKKLRKAQRDVSDNISKDKEELDKLSSNKFNEHRNENNELKKKVVHARELLYDSQNVKALAHSVKNAAGHLDDVSRRYDFSSFAASLTSKYNAGSARLFSWSGYGKDIRVLSRRREQLCTMFGPVGKEIVARAPQRQRVPKDRDLDEKVQAQVVSHTADEEESEATNLRIKQLYELIQEEESFDLLDLLVDRLDQVQTIENFFDFAFLIKEKRASQELIKDGLGSGLLLSRPLDPAKVAVDRDAKQQVLSMSIPDMRTLAELMKEIDDLSCAAASKLPVRRLRNAEQRNILHRDDPLYLAENATQQADILARQAKEKVRSESGPKDAVLSKRKRVADTSSSTNAKKAAKSVKKGPNQNK